MLLILSGPSGCGKTTIAQKVCDRFGYSRSVSYTTRGPRISECEGVDYYFVDLCKFQEMQDQGKFIEVAEVSGNWYGTPSCDECEKKIFVIDPQGARELIKVYPNILRIFLIPPSLEELRRRLIARDQDTRQIVERRMDEYEAFVNESVWYDHVFVNDDLDLCMQEVCEVVRLYTK